MYSGVCAGIAELYGRQPRQVRTVFILLALAGGSSMIAYAILHFLMPPPDVLFLIPKQIKTPGPRANRVGQVLRR